jgi:hypothetical protein
MVDKKQCDKCGKIVTVGLETKEFHTITVYNNRTAYTLNYDVCEQCALEIIKAFKQ